MYGVCVCAQVKIKKKKQEKKQNKTQHWSYIHICANFQVWLRARVQRTEALVYYSSSIWDLSLDKKNKTDTQTLYTNT